jgi:hypothetical protein
MPAFRYKNTSSEVLAIIGVGIVAPDAIIESDHELENANLERVEQPSIKKRKDTK